MRPTLLMHEAAHAIGTIRAHPEYLAALARRGITADMIDQVQIDPWPAGVFGYECEDGRRISRCISFLREDADRQRLRPPDRRPHRALRQRSQRGARGERSRRHPAAAEPRELSRRRPAPHADRPEADLDHAARRAELHRRGQPRAVAEVAVPRRVRSVRRARAAPGRVQRRRRPTAPDPAPRVDQRDGRSLRRPRSACTVGRTRSTRGSGASGG